jgi:hypothetical protein
MAQAKVVFVADFCFLNLPTKLTFLEFPESRTFVTPEQKQTKASWIIKPTSGRGLSAMNCYV